jgi:excisionase family DNA binding protein
MDDTPHETQNLLLHVEEAADILAIGRTKAYELIASGQLHAIRLGRATRISWRELERFVRSVDRPRPERPSPHRDRDSTEARLTDPYPPDAA